MGSSVGTNAWARRTLHTGARSLALADGRTGLRPRCSFEPDVNAVFTRTASVSERPSARRQQAANSQNASLTVTNTFLGGTTKYSATPLDTYPLPNFLLSVR